MTDIDKNTENLDNGTDTALSNVFQRLNEQENLSPSAELDALILKQASEAAVEKVAPENILKSESKSERDSNHDIQFRRKQLEQARTKQKRRKSFLPAWAMPMGLAATVLLSFGVVIQVMQSPEFMTPKGTEYITEAQTSDRSYENSSTELDVSLDTAYERETLAAQAKSDSELASANSARPVMRAEAQTPLDSAKENPASIESQPMNIDSTSSKPSISDMSKTDIRLKKQKHEIVVTGSRQESFDLQAPPPPAQENKTIKLDDVHADVATSSGIAPVSSPDNALQDNVVVSSNNSIESNEHNYSEPEFAAKPSTEEFKHNESSIEEVVITSSRIDENFDINAINESRLNRPLEIDFVDRTCQLNNDCKLISAGTKDQACQIESVNTANYAKYQKGLALNEYDLEKLCPLYVSQCVRNYCQAVPVGLDEAIEE